MKRLVTFFIIATLSLPATGIAQPLTDAQMSAIIQNPGKGREAVLVLKESFILACTGFRVNVWSPESSVRNQARKAKHELRPFTVADVDADTRAGLWRVTAYASTPDKAKNVRLPCAESVTHVVVHNKDGSVTAQPVTKTAFDQPFGAATTTSVQFTGMTATFANADVLKIWGEKRSTPFWITLVGNRGHKVDFEVKSRHFDDLR